MNGEPSLQAGAASDAHRNDPRFVEYYERESATEAAAARARGIMRAVIAVRAGAGLTTENLAVADIGCNAGTQSRCWLERDHRVTGLDISRDLVELARERNREFGNRARFEVGSATALPWDADGFDVVLLPELLEHVEDWRACLNEAVRVLRPRGTLFLSTTNVLCPVQQEFSLPGYSWYPGWLKKRIVAKSLTTHRHWVSFASYPAVHWFSFYGLSRYLAERAVRSLDRFDLIDTDSKGAMARAVVAVVRAVPPLRLLGHVMTPSTSLVGIKRG